MMKAIAIDKYGTVEALEIQHLPLPKLNENDVLIEVHAAAVNPVDSAIRNGWLQERITYEFPLVLGWDVAGIVVAIGSGVTKFKEGDEVYSSPSLSRNGTYAEFVAVEEQLVSMKPKNTTFEGAASIPLVGITAYRALVELGNVQKGQRVLILGGAGGVGTFAIQLAKSYGAFVSATTSSTNVDFVKGLGADEVIDYKTTDLTTYEGDFDLVFDTVGRKSVDQSFDLVKRGGKMVSIATSFTEDDLKRANEKGISLKLFFSEPSGEILSNITSLIEMEKIKPVIGAVYPLENAQEAHQLSETRHARGKIVLRVK